MDGCICLFGFVCGCVLLVVVVLAKCVDGGGRGLMCTLR